MAANSPSPNPKAITTRSIVGLTAFVARIDINPARKKTNVPISSANSFRASKLNLHSVPDRIGLPRLRNRLVSV